MAVVMVQAGDSSRLNCCDNRVLGSPSLPCGLSFHPSSSTLTSGECLLWPSLHPGAGKVVVTLPMVAVQTVSQSCLCPGVSPNISVRSAR